jgi:hypothetical protein
VTWFRSLVVAWLWCYGVPVGAGFFDPAQDKIEVWSSIPLVFASDIEEYKLVRDIFKGLHAGEQQPAKIKALLKQVDKIKGRTTERLWRSYNVALIGHYDRLLDEQRIDSPRLSFSYDGVKPVDVPKDVDLEAQALEQLRQKEGVIGMFAFVTYTKMSLNQMRATLTLVRLKDGISKSFTVTDHLHKIASRHAQLLFDYLYRTPYPNYQNPLDGLMWVLPAPSGQGRRVSPLQARLACRSQGGGLPSVDELMLGEQAGPYHNGIVLKAGAFYHAAEEKRFLAGETMDPRGKIRLLQSDRQMARYYCIQQAPEPVPPEVPVPQKAVVESAPANKVETEPQKEG